MSFPRPPKIVVRAAGLLLQALFPHFCVVCRAEGRMLCARCEPPPGPLIASDAPPQLDGLFATAKYKGSPLAALLHSWKYERVDESGAAVTRLFAAALRDQRAALPPLDGAVFVPVPMHPFREALRGFNQADALARAAGAALALRVAPRLLRRRFRWKRQAATEGRAERLTNAASSVVALRRLPPGTCVVLVDDVATTGATLAACADALRGAGAAHVWAVTLLRD